MAIQHDVDQGSDEWFSLRVGIPTASEFKNIVNEKTGVVKQNRAKTDLGEMPKSYANLKIGEIMTGELGGVMKPTFWMDRGSILEVRARQAYEQIHDVKTENGGFLTDDDGYFGASPDFMIGDDGIGEIKCLETKHHVKYLLDDSDTVPNEYKAQIQGQLFITGRSYCDWWLFHPDLKSKGIRVHRDDEYIANLSDSLNQFRQLMNDKIQQLQDAGLWSQVTPKARNEYSDNILMAG